MLQRKLLLIILLGLILRIGYVVATYEPSLSAYFSDDFVLYRQGAEAILRGDLSFTQDTFLLRPPLFPLMIAALDLRPPLILFANILLSTGIIFLTYLIGRQLELPPKAAALAAIIVALDPSSIRYSAVLLAEPLANLTLALALLSTYKLSRVRTIRSIWLWSLLAGFAIALSALARPAANLLWIPLAPWLLFARRDRRMIAACALVLFALIGTGAWRLHNAETFGHTGYTTLGNWNLLYKRAASVLHHGMGQDIDEALAELARRVEAELGNDSRSIDAAKRHEHYTGTPQLQSAMSKVATDVFATYPLWYLLTFLVGLYRQLFQTVGPLSAPGMAWSAALLLASSYGLWLMLRAKRWRDCAFLLLPCAFFLLGSLVFCTACSAGRDRATVLPLLAVMAAYGVAHLLNRRRARSACPSPPAGS